MNKILLGLLSFTALGLASLPARAEYNNDTAIIQDAVQESIITGDDTSTYQTTIQKNRVYQRGRVRGDSATVQTSNQKCDVLGSRSLCDQLVKQKNVNVRGRSGRRYSRR